MMNNPYEDALIFLLKEHARTGDGPGSQQAQQHLEIIAAMVAAEPQHAEPQQPAAAPQSEPQPE